MHRYIKWSALFKSIAWLSTYAVFFGIWLGINIHLESSSVNPTIIQLPRVMLSTLLLTLMVYAFYSLIIWIFIGFPKHWLIQKFGTGSLWLYITAVVLLILFIHTIEYGISLRDVFIFGFPAVLQVVIFKLYFDQESKEYYLKRLDNS